MLQENWLPINGWEGLYEVSDQGRVRRGDRVLKGQLSAGKPSKRYLMVTLQCAPEGRKAEGRYIHHLVAEAFVGVRPEGQYVRHLDDNQLDNRAVNLAYGTASQNMQDQLVNTGHHYSDRTHCEHGHEFTPENTRWRSDSPNARRCFTCQKQKDRAKYERTKARRQLVNA